MDQQETASTSHQARSSLSAQKSPRITGATQRGETAGDAAGERPYRSHLRPACQACRRRKSRCKVDEGEERGCIMCRVHGTKCEFPSTTSKTSTQPRRTAAPRKRTEPAAAQKSRAGPRSGRASSETARQIRSLDELPDPRPALAPQAQTASLRSHGLARVGDNNDGAVQRATTLIAGLGSPEEEESPHILGPVVTSDTQILAEYLRADPHHGAGRRLARIVRPGRGGGGGGGRGGGGAAAGQGSSSVMFARVRRRPMGQTPNQSVASGKCLIIERIIEPFGDELIDTYFRRANACFPLLDEGSFRDQFRRQPAHISSALLASVYAHALTFWSQPRRAAGRHCPDSRFVWNQATDALYSELQLCPGMSTVVAVLLDVGGRPSTSLIGNGVLIGSAVSIAHGLGLHRDPSDWDISEPEKTIRVQIWWALLVHDRWFSLAYGTPPHIQGQFHDAPRPRADGGGNTVFLALVSLSEVLDAFLVHIYALKPDSQGTSEFDPGAALRRWEGSLIGDMRRLIIQGRDLSAPGASNLRLSYLFVRLLQRRMELDSNTDKGQHAATDNLSARYIHLREAAEDIVRLAQALRAPQLNDFWLPTAAFIFTSTIAFLLRVALETEKTGSGLGGSVSLSLANDLLAALKGHQQNFGWDLGDACIAQYADVVEELRKATPVASNAGQGEQDTAVSLVDWQDFDMSGLPDVDELFPNLWDMFDSNY
ncbi:hypothetical protein KVR01_012350 [Diaporthe batatas]|uniref:uncharacterized protein n=1 Tax=Diaporthe batatas TaxID=748121 RepID=UPI001D03D629|nr:uncharacterized protein KVR01_012350 [Diaporthe batatas]KAG8157688.1 hypothetical protein KVR01_012350 [Diaporthe batatas]